MMEITKDQVALNREILDGILTVDEVKGKLHIMEEKWGCDEFYRGYFFERKARPWDRAYLEELTGKSMTGAFSKEFILHLAEVSEEVHRKERNKKLLKNVGVAFGAAIAICAIVVLVIWLIKQLR